MKIRILQSHSDESAGWSQKNEYDVPEETGRRKVEQGLAERIDIEHLVAVYLKSVKCGVFGPAPAELKACLKEQKVRTRAK